MSTSCVQTSDETKRISSIKRDILNAPKEVPVWEPLPGSRTICKVFMHLFSRYHVTGLENIPKAPYLVTINHLSYWDAPAIGSQFKDTVPTFTARKFKGTFVGLLLHVG